MILDADATPGTMKDGKHKVFIEFQRVEDMAVKTQFKFKGYKRGTLEDEDTVFNGEYIKTYEKDLRNCSNNWNV